MCPESVLVKMGKEESVGRGPRHQAAKEVSPSVGLLLYAATWLILELQAPAAEEGRQMRQRTLTVEGLKTKLPDRNLTLGHRQ